MSSPRGRGRRPRGKPWPHALPASRCEPQNVRRGTTWVATDVRLLRVEGPTLMKLRPWSGCLLRLCLLVLDRGRARRRRADDHARLRPRGPDRPVQASGLHDRAEQRRPLPGLLRRRRASTRPTRRSSALGSRRVRRSGRRPSRSRTTRSARSATASSGRHPTASSGCSTSSGTARPGRPRGSSSRSRATTPRPGRTPRSSRSTKATWSAAGRSCSNDGDYLLPIYHETGHDPESVGPDSTSLFLRFNPAKKTWTKTGADPLAQREHPAGRRAARRRPT